MAHNGTTSSLGSGSLGHGVVVWDRSRLNTSNDYLTVAHIRPDRSIQWRAEVSEEQRTYIEHLAKHDDRAISITQSEKVFLTRPTPNS